MTTSTVLMVPPDYFTYNPQTAETNIYQNKPTESGTISNALYEFDQMVSALIKKDIQVLILTQNRALPDAVFPNNWFSTHLNKNGKTDIILYPMLVENRQKEVNESGLIELFNAAQIEIGEIFDLRTTTQGILEGTGSAVLDQSNQLLYACRSPRTSEEKALELAQLLGYKPIIFNAVNHCQQPIYHTNIMLSIAQSFAMICLESISTSKDKNLVLEQLESTHKEIIEISLEQIKRMCGNTLELVNLSGQRLLVLSKQAYQGLFKPQIKRLEQHCELIIVDIETIETIGGGSARCMMAEIYTRNLSKH